MKILKAWPRNWEIPPKRKSSPGLTKDAPILAAAIEGDIDIIISGDGHFLSLDIKHPRMMTAA
jgi:predicted nucleic acid-binding protein